MARAGGVRLSLTPSDFALPREMREAPDILRRFDADIVAAWRPLLQSRKRVLLTGEGSSRILPAHHLISRGLRDKSNPVFWTCGAREALDYDLRDCAIVCASNSGRTRELLDLLEFANAHGIPSCAVTATAGSPVTTLATHHLVLSCGAEQAVAASKSVFEQTLVYHALLQGHEWQDQAQAADLCAAFLDEDVPDGLTALLARAGTVYVAGRNDGVAEELTLKTTEILRKKAVYLEGTFLLHGIEEVFQPDDLLILIEPFAADAGRIRERIVDGTGMPVIAIASGPTPFPTLRIAQLDGFDAYLQLLAGWRLLVAAAMRNGLNLDRAKRARKAGNAV